MLVALERALHLAASMELDANLLVAKSRIPPLAPFAAVIGYVYHWAKVDVYQTKDFSKDVESIIQCTKPIQVMHDAEREHRRRITSRRRDDVVTESDCAEKVVGKKSGYYSKMLQD
ncbi:hypothetical protein PC121_g12167 [Phytophthora cactorum]|nr:hypothetical protein PC120_g10261 [Phytophthora cactorum]KAG3063399.1 hypothetical protein PC121_g12167 [Phytophthora cactorum]KAG4054715.1 hypothetical protein PC123_g10165 [Phytophthora cactorum]